MILRTCVIRTYFSCINDQQIFNFTLPYMPLEPFYRQNTKYYLTFTKHITLFEQRNHTPPPPKKNQNIFKIMYNIIHVYQKWLKCVEMQNQLIKS